MIIESPEKKIHIFYVSSNTNTGMGCKASTLMYKVNPAFIPRNHKLEEAIEYAAGKKDFSKMHKLIEILSNPYDDKQKDAAEYMRAPKASERVYQTFCGT